MKNYRAPRTLADCEWTAGYPMVPRSVRQSPVSYLLAIAIGVALGWSLIYGWSM
jgi:hypothetical protein